MNIGSAIFHPTAGTVVIPRTRDFVRDVAYRGHYTTAHDLDFSILKVDNEPKSFEMHVKRGIPALPTDKPDARTITSWLRFNTDLRKHDVELARKMRSRKDKPQYAAEYQQLNQLQKAIRNHPLYDVKKIRALAKQLPDYGKLRAFNDNWHAVNSWMALQMRENRWIAAPLAVTVLILKLTVGLWLLHQFDKLFGTKSVKGEPFAQPTDGGDAPLAVAQNTQALQHFNVGKLGLQPVAYPNAAAPAYVALPAGSVPQISPTPYAPQYGAAFQPQA